MLGRRCQGLLLPLRRAVQLVAAQGSVAQARASRAPEQRMSGHVQRDSERQCLPNPMRSTHVPVAAAAKYTIWNAVLRRQRAVQLVVAQGSAGQVRAPWAPAR